MDNKCKQIMYVWLKPVFSLKRIWYFLPGILGVVFVYWAEVKGYQALILKEYHEPIAIGLLSIATLLFLIRLFCYRMEIDLILTAVAVNFLCREIHFKGTDNAVVIVAAAILIWALLRKNKIWVIIGEAKLFQLSLTGTAVTYFFSILISRRVFSIDNLPILPNEEYMYDRLEEVIENVAHLFLIFSGIVAFFSIEKQHQRHSKLSKSSATKRLNK
jgi:hypothetical protein